VNIFEQLAKKLGKNWHIAPNTSERAGLIFTKLSKFVDKLMRVTKLSHINVDVALVTS